MASLPLGHVETLLRTPAPSPQSPPPLHRVFAPAFLDDEDERTPGGKLKHRAVWISDVHLGTPGCNADRLLDFLKAIQPDTLYLVGDIIDGWKLKRGWYWPQRHNDVVRRVLKLAAKGTRVIFIPGNHDEFLRPYAGMAFGGVEIALEAIHTTVDGRRLLVCHGDEFDGVVLYHRWLAWAGDVGYELLLKLNRHFNIVRQQFGLPYWSISAHIKKKVKNAVAFIGRFEEAVAEAARMRGLDGVVCGHIHCAEIRDFGGITYMNDGDWVESCTALVEHHDGRIEIVDWSQQPAPMAVAAAAAPQFAAAE
ncbi:MAG: UDP-2,3-diacylglucosamine diphosphatase [Sphingomonadales bacterium]|jgi:UDP-2,3-diacylglucosamine pyrophosphatase LpxH